MLSKIKFNQHSLVSLRYYCTITTTTNANVTNPNIKQNTFRVAVENENENHNVMANNHSERFKYKTQTNENFLSQSRTVENNTSTIEKVQVLLSASNLKNQKLSEMNNESRDRLGQWPYESESEVNGQGMERLNNGRFNKVSKFIDSIEIQYEKLCLR
jgi:hypothetical protein